MNEQFCRGELSNTSLLLQRIEQLEQEKAEFKCREEALKRINQLLVDAISKKTRPRWEDLRGKITHADEGSFDQRTPIDRLAQQPSEIGAALQSFSFQQCTYPSAQHLTGKASPDKWRPVEAGKICWNNGRSKQEKPFEVLSEVRIARNQRKKQIVVSLGRLPTADSLPPEACVALSNTQIRKQGQRPIKFEATKKTDTSLLQHRKHQSNKQNDAPNTRKRLTNKTPSRSQGKPFTDQPKDKFDCVRTSMQFTDQKNPHRTRINPKKAADNSSSLIKKSVRFLKC